MFLLWERLHQFLTTFDLTPISCPTVSRIQRLEHALRAANAALSDERSHRAHWEERALVATAAHGEARAELEDLIAKLDEAGKSFTGSENAARNAPRPRSVAEEQRDIALQRLSEALQAVKNMQAEKNQAESDMARIVKENEVLRKQMHAAREAGKSESEQLLTELADRKNKFAQIEKQLKDARETYITVAKNFDEQLDVFAQHLAAAHDFRDAICADLTAMKVSTRDNHQRLKHCADRCQKLETENASLRSGEDVYAGVSSNKENFADVVAQHDEIRRRVEFVSRDATTRLSSSSLSSSSGSMAVANRAAEPELKDVAARQRRGEWLRRIHG